MVQDIFLKITPPPEQDIGNPAAYLYRLGSNLMLDRLKQARRSGKRDTDWQDFSTSTYGADVIASEKPADLALAARQRLSAILAVVNRLPPQVQEAFRLHKLEGLSHAETAAAMGVSRSSVEKYIMTSLKRILEETGR